MSAAQPPAGGRQQPPDLGPTPIGYAADGGRSGARRWLGRMALAAAVIASILLARHHRTMGEAAAFLHNQWQCATFLAPADQVVYDEAEQAATTPPPMPACWAALRAWHGYPDPGCANLFLHERTSAGGAKRIVAIDLEAAELRAGSDRATLVNQMWEPRWSAGPTGNGKGDKQYERKRTGWSHVRLARQGKDDRLRFFAGRPDEHDPSLFYLPFEWRGQRNELKGQLQDDGRVSYTLPPVPGLSGS